jgi:hypothetical protein
MMDEGRDGDLSTTSCQGLLPDSRDEGREERRRVVVNMMDEGRDGDLSTTSCQGLLPGSRDEGREERRRVVVDEKTECGNRHTSHSS